MQRYMLDTDTCSHILKRSSDAVLSKLRRIPMSDVCISVITKAELLFAAALSPLRQQDALAVDAFLDHIAVLDFSSEAASHYADIRAELKVRGETIGANDLFIAAHARSVDATLVTNNRRELGRVASLKIENWAAAVS